MPSLGNLFDVCLGHASCQPWLMACCQLAHLMLSERAWDLRCADLLKARPSHSLELPHAGAVSSSLLVHHQLAATTRNVKAGCSTTTCTATQHGRQGAQGSDEVKQGVATTCLLWGLLHRSRLCALAAAEGVAAVSCWVAAALCAAGDCQLPAQARMSRCSSGFCLGLKNQQQSVQTC